MYQGVPPTVNPSFLRKLKEFDPALRVEFSREAHRFVITKPRAYGAAWQLHLVQSEDGDFRQPDERDIAVLWLGDLWRHGGPKARVRRGEDYMLDYQDREDRRISEEFRETSRDNKIQLRRMYRRDVLGDGKGNAEFRRVNLKRRGLTISEIHQSRALGIDPWAQAKVA